MGSLLAVAHNSSQDISLAIVGSGGLGTPAAWTLARNYSGKAKLRVHLIDPDQVELSNLNRQVLFKNADIAKSKSERLAKELESVNPEISWEASTERLSKDNIQTLLSPTSYVIDGTDDVEIKFLISDFCTINNIAFCYAGVAGSKGVLLSRDKEGACLRCLFGDFKKEDFETQTTTCKNEGIIGPVAGHIGTLQALECLEFLSGRRQSKSKYIRFDLNTLEHSQSFISKSKDCPICNSNSETELDLSDQECPMTFVYTKVALEELKGGDLLSVSFSNEDSSRNVEASCQEEGYSIISASKQTSNGNWNLKIQAKP